MNTLQKVLSISLIVAVVLLGFVLARPVNVNVQMPESQFTAGSANANHTELESFFGGIQVGQGFGQGVKTPTVTGGGSNFISTTTSFCIINPPTATSTFTTGMRISSSSPNTNVMALATTTNPYATSTLTSLLTQSDITGATLPMFYRSTANMFITPQQYLVYYYTNLTTSGQNAQQAGGNCGAVYYQF